jgi:hypothetical protein
MRNDLGTLLDAPAPDHFFSLELPGSQGSHAGHSGILQGDPNTLASGRLSREDFDRLAALATDGFLKRSDVSHFIAHNLKRDPNAKVAQAKVFELLAIDFLGFVEAAARDLASRLFTINEEDRQTHRQVEEKLTKLMGEDNLVGSSGEFGLLFAFLSHSPATAKLDGEPALSLGQVQTMFVKKELPEGWGTWRKSRLEWVFHTTALLFSAAKEYHRLT